MDFLKLLGRFPRGFRSWALNPTAKMGRNLLAGMGIGAAYGAMSDDTSIAKGALYGLIGGGIANSWKIMGSSALLANIDKGQGRLMGQTVLGRTLDLTRYGFMHSQANMLESLGSNLGRAATEYGPKLISQMPYFSIPGLTDRSKGFLKAVGNLGSRYQSLGQSIRKLA